ncbi:PREDICTED: taste receptor type 2 member 38-like [Chrysochloris asiatica]|uniref:Taste receptor type 2 n=1 Tax=Chrysochloris asiatica TaxID=185453 RepID=A0A9B0TIW3_CHRAS|nr:PREDICTED: taste receptor type 2 member 38-like [Chrysochloris asiatica]
MLTPVITVSYEVKIVFLLLSILEFIVGVLANAFIFLVNLWDIVKRRPLTSCDMVLLSLSTTRLFLHGLLFLDAIQLTHFQQMKDPLNWSYQAILVLWMVTNQANFWLATCLSIHYCCKIVHFSHTTLLCLARCFSKKMPQMLVGVITFSGVCTFLCLWDFFSRSRFMFTTVLLVNNTEKGNPQIHFLYSFLFCNLGSFPPFFCFLACSGMLIVSLQRHLRTMRANSCGSRDPSLEAHIKALNSLVSFLFFYIVAFCAALLSVPLLLLWHSKIGVMVCVAVMAACPSGHAVVLISSSGKLRRTVQTILLRAQSSLKVRAYHKADPRTLC